MSMPTRGVCNCSYHIQEGREKSKANRPMARSTRSGNTHSSRQPSQSATQQRHTIIIEDDDDDVQASSPRSFALAKSSGRASRHRDSSMEDTAVHEDPLELRLGPTGFTPPASLRLRMSSASRPHIRPARGIPLTIDLTSATPSNDDCIIITEKKAPHVPKRKRGPSVPAAAVNDQAGQGPAKELRLTCPICMDVMKEETSTICGHLFCRECIFGAIASQKKCPTCRHRLTSKCTHRIYLTASLRNS